jgi:hypothetical protein
MHHLSVDQSPRMLEQARRSMGLVEDNKLVFLMGQVKFGFGEASTVGT